MSTASVLTHTKQHHLWSNHHSNNNKKNSIDDTIISIYCYLCLVIVDSISFWSGTMKSALSPQTDET